MKTTTNMKNGSKAKYWQEENGVYFAEIRDEWNDIAWCTISKTVAEIHEWIEEHDF